MEIRPATEKDAKALLDIYSYYVENTAISFEYDTPSLEEFTNRISNTLKKYPYLVASVDDKIVGYAYAGPFKTRRAYDHCVETSVYVHKDYRKQGIGKALYEELQKALVANGILNIYACIAVCNTEDEYLTNNSWEFHEHMGFTVAGRFHSCGRKFGNTYDMIWMEKMGSDSMDAQKNMIIENAALAALVSAQIQK